MWLSWVMCRVSAFFFICCGMVDVGFVGCDLTMIVNAGGNLI